jgi:hypothetical protein
MPMTEVVVSAPSTAPELLALRGQQAPPPCCMVDLAPAAGAAGAVAVFARPPVGFRVRDAASLLAAL